MPSPDQPTPEDAGPDATRQGGGGTGEHLGTQLGAWTSRLPSMGFLVLHFLGGLYALVTLQIAWQIRFLVQIVVDHATVRAGTTWAGSLVPWVAGSFIAPFVLLVLLAAGAVGVTIRRLWRHQTESDVALRLRGLLYVAVACLFVNAFLLSTPSASSGTLRARLPPLSFATAAIAYGAYTLWSLLLPRIRRAFSLRVRRGLDLVCMNVVLVLVLAELGARAVAQLAPSPLLITQSTSPQARRDASRDPPGSMRFSFPVNQTGHYDTEFVPRAAARGRIVVAIGDSYSYGTVPHAFHFTTVAEGEIPGVEIYNMGYPKLGPHDYLDLLEREALPLDPDLIVVNLFMGNDVTDIPPAADPWRWYDGEHYLIAVVWHRLRLIRRADPSPAAEVVAPANLTREALALQYPWLADPFQERPFFSAEVYFQVETRQALATCSGDDSTYRRFFESLAALQWAAGTTPLAFMVIPAAFQVEEDRWQEIVRRVREPLDCDLVHYRVVEWLRQRGLPVLDLLPVLRQVPLMVDGRRHLYLRQDTHFNARGNDVAGRALAPFVDSLLSGRPRLPGGRPGTPVAASPAPVSLPFALNLGDSTARRWMDDGWHEDEGVGERSYVWSAGTRSVLRLPLPAGGDLAMTFEALPFAFPRSPQQHVSVVLNGTVIETVALRPGLQRYALRLPSVAVRDGVDVLEFRYAYARSPRDVIRSAQDRRLLAVAWYSIGFEAQRP